MEKVDGKDLLINDLKKENLMLKNRLEEISCERDYLKFSLDETRKSVTYRIGRVITWLPRMIRK